MRDLRRTAVRTIQTRGGPAAQLTVRTVRAALNDRVPGLSAEVAFYLLLSLPPLLLALLGSVGYLGDLLGETYALSLRARLLEAAGAIFTAETVDETVAPTVDTLFEEGRAGIASLGALVTLWSASRAINVMLATITIAYDLERRPGWRRRAQAFGMTIAAVLAGLLLVPLLVLGPRLAEALAEPLGLDAQVRQAWEIAYWPMAVVLATLALALLYHFGTPWHTPWRRDLPGAALAMTVWLAGSAGLRAYATFTIEQDAVYQQFAAPLVMLLWLYVLGFAVLLGAELNAEIERMWPTIRREETEAARPRAQAS